MDTSPGTDFGFKVTSGPGPDPGPDVVNLTLSLQRHVFQDVEEVFPLVAER